MVCPRVSKSEPDQAATAIVHARAGKRPFRPRDHGGHDSAHRQTSVLRDQDGPRKVAAAHGAWLAHKRPQRCSGLRQIVGSQNPRREPGPCRWCVEAEPAGAVGCCCGRIGGNDLKKFVASEPHQTVMCGHSRMCAARGHFHPERRLNICAARGKVRRRDDDVVEGEPHSPRAASSFSAKPS